MLTSIDLVIFDMDGVIFDTETLAIAAWSQASASLGIEVPVEAVIETIGLSAEHTRQVYARHLGETFPYDMVLKERLRIGWEQVREHGAPLKGGLIETLDFLSARDMSLAVATSTNTRRARHLLDKAEITDRFGAIVTGDMVAHTKPAPDLFLEAAHRMDATPERCLVIEDSDFGILAAHSAGMTPVFVQDIKQPGPDIEALMAARFEDLRRFIAAAR